MMPSTFIYASGDDDQMIKLIVGVIVAIFWAIGGIASAIKKRSDEAQKRARMRPVSAGSPAGVAAEFPTAKRVKDKPQRRAIRQQAIAAQPPAPSRPSPAQPAQAAQPAPPPKVKATAVPPNQIAVLLRRPESLRAAMILKEVLSPPLALRENASGGRIV